ncbi:Zinc knuckle [Popillia japonica]|uniref:Zinc knuckle n=1 Tax=Popillia japonica TaxID=7064 RepID=A0AAW1JUN2_POPJA
MTSRSGAYDSESFEQFQSQYGEEEQAAEEVQDKMAGKDAGNETDTITKLFAQMMIENRRRDALLETLVNRIVNTTPEPTAVCNASIMPDLLQKIPTFDGSTDKAEGWIYKLESAQLLHSLPDNYVLETARTRLVSGAHHWYVTKRSQISTWEDFVHLFKATFIIEEATSDRYKKMINRTQRPGESVDSYFHEKVRMCTELNLSAKEMKKEVLVGLRSKTLCDAMLMREHFTTDDLLHGIHEFLNIETKRYGRTTNIQNQNTDSRPSGNRFTSREQANQPVCYSCKKSGHISKNCTERRCFQCGQAGHKANNCTRRNTNREQQPTTSENPTLMVRGKEHASAYMLPIFLETFNFKFCSEAILDSGSPVSLISSSVTNNVKLTPVECSSYHGINGSKLEVLGKVDFNMTVSQFTTSLNFLVVSAGTMPYQCLLGRNFINSNLNISFQGGKLLIEPLDLLNDSNLNH